MLKTILIGIKDVKLAFRDRAALILMLAAPFLLTLGMGLVTGRFSGRTSGISDIPVVIVNQDDGELGKSLVDVFNSEELADLVEPTLGSDPEAARSLVEEDEAAAAIIIPAGFSQSIIPKQEDFAQGSSGPKVVQIELYANPTRPTSAGIIKSIVDEFLSRIEEGRVGAETSILQMIVSGRIQPQEAEAAGKEMGQRFVNDPNDDAMAITLNTTTEGEEVEFDVLAYLAPGMALMFLMYTVSYGGRSILAEKTQGTLPRLLVSPTNSTQILGGKVFGIFLTGTAQMLVLIGTTSLLFQLKWGDPLAVIVLVLSAVFGATGWGMLITAVARTPGQVASIGSAVMLIFGILGGSFISLEQMPPFIQTMSRITPNSWALDGFTSLAFGGTLSNLSTPITALLTMGLILFTVSVILFGRKNLVQK